MTKDQKLDAYQEQLARLQMLGLQIHENPYDINGVVVKTGDRVRLTAGYDEEIVEGIATLSDDPNLRNCIVVDGWTSAAFLWEVV